MKAIYDVNEKIIKDVESNKEIIPNSTDASIEKHVPEYEIVGDSINVIINHVMEYDHYIEWIMFKSEDMTIFKYFEPGYEPIMVLPYKKGTLYSYCNKHGLWSKEVK